MKAKLFKLQPVKDENGNFVYDEKAIAKFRQQKTREMERQNAKIAASPKLQRSFSICDPSAFAEQQIAMYRHNFRVTERIEIAL